ncbi:hypothetical protein CN602_28830 [Bacillus cereus]|nr:hypothetical protein CN602_28830 [Bacillus cereus]
MRYLLKKTMSIIKNIFVNPETTKLTVSMDNIEFSGITAPLEVNVRDDKNLNSRVVDVLPGNSKVTFNGWEYGEKVRDYWTGMWDNRWFYYYKGTQKLFITSAYVYGNPPNILSERRLFVPDVLQEKSNWCWAGVSAATLNYFNKAVTQEQFVRYVKNGVYNNPATSIEIQYGLSRCGIRSYRGAGSKSYDWFQSQINNNQPIIVLIMWQGGGNIGHFFVLDGYYKGENGINYITYMDPWYGDHYNYNYNTFENNNTFWWSETIYDIQIM